MTSTCAANTPPLTSYDIGVDIDGVLYDFTAAFADEAARHGVTVPSPAIAHRWEFFYDWGLSLQEFLTIYAAGVNAGRVLWQGQPMPGAREGLLRLHAAGHRLHALTDRTPPGAEINGVSATHAWLNNHDMSRLFTSITFTPDKTRILQHSQVRSERVWFIEDKPANHHALRDAGVESYLVNAPYNQDADGPRVTNLVEFADLVNAAATLDAAVASHPAGNTTTRQRAAVA